MLNTKINELGLFKQTYGLTFIQQLKELLIMEKYQIMHYAYR